MAILKQISGYDSAMTTFETWQVEDDIHLNYHSDGFCRYFDLEVRINNEKYCSVRVRWENDPRDFLTLQKMNNKEKRIMWLLVHGFETSCLSERFEEILKKLNHKITWTDRQRMTVARFKKALRKEQ